MPFKIKSSEIKSCSTAIINCGLQLKTIAAIIVLFFALCLSLAGISNAATYTATKNVNTKNSAWRSLPVMLLLLCLLFVSNSFAATYYAGTTADQSDGGDCTNAGNTDCSLRDAVAAATASGGDDTVQVPAGTYVLSLGQIQSNNGMLHVVGAGSGSTIIDGNNASRIFEALWTSAGFTFTDITLTQGDAGTGYGGCVKFTNNNLTVTDSVFSNCKAKRGGAIYSDQTITVSVSGSAFNDNTAVSNDASQGGGAISAKAVTITSSTFSGNTATGASARGGAINSPSTISVTGSTFTNNHLTTGGQGGALFALSTITIDTSVFINNSTASGTSGAVHINAGAGTITDSTFSSNSATGDGGAIYSIADITISGSSFDGNSTSGGTGGAVARYGNVNVTNSTFSGNSSSHHGGAIRGGTTTSVKYSTFYNNSTTSAGTGGAIYADSANVEGTIFTANTANSVAGNCAGTVTSAGYNIDHGSTCGFTFTTGDQDADPELQALADNGGPTETHAILSGSPAADAGPATCSASPVNGIDQRGITRPQGSNCDIGSFEYVGGTAPTYQPDSLIKLSTEADESYLTDNTYEAAASAQTKSKSVLSASTATYSIKFENDGGTTDSLIITGTGSGSGFTVQYLDDVSTDRTADVTGAGYAISGLAAGANKVWTLNITPSGSVTGGTSYNVFVTVTSSNDSNAKDQVKGLTTSNSANLTLVKSVDKPTADPDEDLTYSVTATNGSGLTDASSIVLTDAIPTYTGFKISGATFNTGTSTLASAITYSNDSGSSWTYTPASGGCSAPSGYDYCVTNVKWSMTGNMPSGTNFSIGLIVGVK